MIRYVDVYEIPPRVRYVEEASSVDVVVGKKRGRPRKADALSAAEKQRRYRERKRGVK